VHTSLSIKWFTLYWFGYVFSTSIHYQVSQLGNIFKVEIGFSEKGPNILPINLSLSNLICVSVLCVSTDTIFVDYANIRGPVYWSLKPYLSPDTNSSASLLLLYSTKYLSSTLILIGVLPLCHNLSLRSCSCYCLWISEIKLVSIALWCR
jgi:hypothetical protein